MNDAVNPATPSKPGGLFVVPFLLLAIFSSCCIYDANTFASMNEEGATMLRSPDSEVALGAEPVVIEGSGDRACLLIHGFGSSPADFGGLAEALHEAGFHVEAILLPGHGTDPERLSEVSRRDWLEAASSAFARLSARFRKVSVVGFSMGASVAAVLSKEARPHRLVLWAPFVSVSYRWYYVLPAETWTALMAPFIRYVRRPDALSKINDRSQVGKFFQYRHLSLAAIGEVYRVGLEAFASGPEITCPVLFLHSRQDSVAGPATAQRLFESITSGEKELIWLDRSDHILGWDYDRELVVRESVSFLSR